MRDQEELQRLLEINNREVERLKAIQKRKKKSDMIIGAGVSLVIIGLALVFITPVFDFIMPERSVNQRVLAVISAIPFSLGIHTIYTRNVTYTISLNTSEKEIPSKFKFYTALWFVTGVFILYLAVIM